MKVFQLLGGDGGFEPSWLTTLNWAWVMQGNSVLSLFAQASPGLL